jgi:erythromycin esterase-like protein
VKRDSLFIAWEADRPDALRVNRYIHGNGADEDAAEVLADFERFPCLDVGQTLMFWI